MTFEQIIQEVKKGNIAPIYFLQGEEPYFIDKIAETVQKHALTDEERGFNELIMYGKDTDTTYLVHIARQFPMGAQRQLIIVREAQNLSKIETLEHYFKTPQPSTVLVISYKNKKLDKRTKTYTTLSKQSQAIFFDSKKLYDNQMEQWILKYIKECGLTIENRATALLIDYLGTELEKVVQTIEKLKVALGPEKKQITVDDVMKNVGIHKEFNPFELQTAITNKDILKANRIVKALASSKDFALPVITAIFFNYFSKLLLYIYHTDKNNTADVAIKLNINPYFVSDYKKGYQNYKGRKVTDIISLLREYDMKSKGFGNVSTSQGDLLKELVFKILH
ncbi:MAG: DNA polymerase III subunit delta [Marinilabiliaceae bacterium]|nr:DNA polymerase III subunit delta [Marinilabiliaceae bacterium]